MSASLCIQVTSFATQQMQEVKFFETQEWNKESEDELLIRTKEILSLIRNIGKDCEIRIHLRVDDMQAAIFQIRKKTSHHFEAAHQKLTVREMEILGLIMQGLTNQEIAKKLFISFETVRSHRKNILEKTGAKNTAALISYSHQAFFEK
jgi:DNA-binding CsgD family transcriptional regulator